MDDVQSFLSHHGIKGQKWGVRNDRKTSGRVGSSGDDLAPVAFMGAALLAIWGTQAIVHLKDSGKFHSATEKGKRFVTSRTDWNKDPSLSKKMTPNEAMTKVVKEINPEYGKSGTKMNCRRCTFAYEMRRRGYDVSATRSNYATGQGIKGLSSALGTNPRQFHAASPFGKTLVPAKTHAEVSKNIFTELNKQPKGARGELGIAYAFGGGHSMAWENFNGKTVVFDTQNGKKFSTPSEFLKNSGLPPLAHVAYTRLDNANLDQKFLTRWLKDAA